MPTIRQLTTTFGIEIDTTPLKRYNSAIKRARNDTKRLGNVKLTGLRRRIDGLTRALRVGMVGAVGVVTTALVGSVKAFTKFGDQEAALIRLKTQMRGFPGEFEKTIKTIDQTRGKIDGLTSRVDLLNKASRFFRITTDPEALRETIVPTEKLSLLLGEDLFETVAQAITSGNADAIKVLGFFTTKELEVLTKAGSEFKEVGIAQRTKQIVGLFAKATPRIESLFDELTKTGRASALREKAARDDLVVAIGKNVTFLKTVNEDFARFWSSFRKNIESEGGILAGIDKNLADSRKKVIEEDEKRRKEGKTPLLPTDIKRPGFLVPGSQQEEPKTFKKKLEGSGLLGMLFSPFVDKPANTTINTNITVTGVDTNNQAEVGRVVKSKAEESYGAVLQQAKRNTLIRGQNQTRE